MTKLEEQLQQSLSNIPILEKALRELIFERVKEMAGSKNDLTYPIQQALEDLSLDPECEGMIQEQLTLRHVVETLLFIRFLGQKYQEKIRKVSRN